MEGPGVFRGGQGVGGECCLSDEITKLDTRGECEQLARGQVWVPTSVGTYGVQRGLAEPPRSLSAYAVYFIKVQQLELGLTCRCLSVWGSAGVGFLCLALLGPPRSPRGFGGAQCLPSCPPACLPVSHWDELPVTGQDSGCRVSSPWHPQGGGPKGGARKEPPGLWRLPSGPACLWALLVRSGSLSMQGIWFSSPTKNQLSPHWSSLAPEERGMYSGACHKASRFQASLCCTEGGI